MRKKLLIFLSIFVSISLVAQKETILLRKIEATNAVESARPQSLNAYLESLPTHFINYLNQTGKYAVVDLSSVFSVSNLDLELENSEIFKTTDKELIDKPKYTLNCTVVEFSENENSINNPLDGSTRLNRDIFVSVTMQLTNRANPSDQKTFEVPPLNNSWDEDLYGSATQRDFQSRKKVDQFAKSAALSMSRKFVEGFEQKIYLYGKNGDQCSMLAGYQNGVQVGQRYDVFISKSIIHPITKKTLAGTQITQIGLIEIINTQSDVSTCKIVEDFGINTDVAPENLPIARKSNR